MSTACVSPEPSSLMRPSRGIQQLMAVTSHGYADSGTPAVWLMDKLTLFASCGVLLISNEDLVFKCPHVVSIRAALQACPDGHSDP